MPNYVMNKNSQSNGDHEVHEDTCSDVPEPQNQLALGWHLDCHGAMRVAEELDPDADGCAYCCPDCHSS